MVITGGRRRTGARLVDVLDQQTGDASLDKKSAAAGHLVPENLKDLMTLPQGDS